MHGTLARVMRQAVLAFLLLGCAHAPDVASDIAALKKADSDFAAATNAEGRAGFLRYVAADAISLPPNDHVVRGAQKIADNWAPIFERRNLTWKPAEAAASGDLGYTMGYYEAKAADGTTRYGKYVTIWRRQPDGSWKWVVDLGTPSPGPPP